MSPLPTKSTLSKVSKSLVIVHHRSHTSFIFFHQIKPIHRILKTKLLKTESCHWSPYLHSTSDHLSTTNNKSNRSRHRSNRDTNRSFIVENWWNRGNAPNTPNDEGSTLTDRQWKPSSLRLFLTERSKPIEGGGGREREGREEFGERRDVSRSLYKSLVSGFRPVSSRTAFDAETRINSSVEMESRWGTGEKQRAASCYAALVRRIRTGFDSMSANLSSDKADRSRFRLSRVSTLNFGNDRYHTSTGWIKLLTRCFLFCPAISPPSFRLSCLCSNWLKSD